MRDSHGRAIEDLRLSVTKESESRCMYGNSAEDVGSGIEPLSAGEIECLVRHLVLKHGIRKVRLTGPEPTKRADLVEIVGRLGGIGGLEDLAMTTDGLALAEQAKALKKAGLRRVNISLDSLDPEKYERIRGVDGLVGALRGIDAAMAAGLTPVKLNTVVVRGENDQDVSELLLFAVDKGLEIRFIELMPVGPGAGRWEERYVAEQEIRQRLGDVVTTWRPGVPGNESARRYRVGLPYGRRGTVGFVSAMSCPFCNSCNRIRIGADGTFYPCLMNRGAGSVMGALRPGFRAEELDRLLGQGLSEKAQEHPSFGLSATTGMGG